MIMQVKPKVHSIHSNQLTAPPYIHRHLDGKPGWRLQPAGWIEHFSDEKYGGPELALEATKRRVLELLSMKKTELLALFNPTLKVQVNCNGQLLVTLLMTRGFHGRLVKELRGVKTLPMPVIHSMGERWAGWKLYEFQVKQSPAWLPLTVRSEAFEVWQHEMLACLKQSRETFAP